MGLVDLHNHLLWALDDGCETPEETLATARVLAALGFDEVAASPHAVRELPSFDADRCEARRGEAQALLAGEGIALTLHASAENRLDDEFVARAAGAGRRGIGPTGRWALVEAPFRAPLPGLAERIAELRALGVWPLVAHPERCAEFHCPGRAAEVVRAGAALQLNVGALTGVYGARARELARRFLGEGLYAVAATDLHGPEGAADWLAESLDALEREAGRDGVERLLSVHPRRILAGEELP
jgi:protein-tyrosine phosphatase